MKETLENLISQCYPVGLKALELLKKSESEIEENPFGDPSRALTIAKSQNPHEAGDNKIDTAAIASIGLEAYHNEHVVLAELCLEIARSASGDDQLRTLIKCDMLQAGLLCIEQTIRTSSRPGSASTKMESRRLEALKLARRIEALKMLDRTLISCKRLEDPDLFQELCALIWDLGMPLLQAPSRCHVHKAFVSAAESLDEIDSLMTQLRAQLHLEAGKCEIETDFASKALVHIDTALSLDYGVNEQQLVGERSLDRFLLALHSKLQLKTNIYKQPEGDFEQVMLFIEQARDAKQVELKKTILTKATQQLQNLSDLKTNSEHGIESKEPMEDRGTSVFEDIQMNRTLFKLWSEIGDVAWSDRLLDIAKQAAQLATQNFEWKIEQDKDLCVRKAEMHLIYGEVCVEMVKRIAQANSDSSEGAADSRHQCMLGVQVEENTDPILFKLKHDIVESFICALRIGVSAKESWLVVNAVVFLWNFHFPFLKRKRYDNILPSLVDALVECYDSLRELDIDQRDPILLCTIGTVAAEALRQQNKLDQSVQLCLSVLNLSSGDITALKQRNAASSLARVLDAQGKAGAIPELSDPRLKVSVLLELANLSHRNNAHRQQALEDAVQILSGLHLPWFPTGKRTPTLAKVTILEVEHDYLELFVLLWSQLSRVSFELNRLDVAQRCAATALSALPDSDKVRRELPNRIWRWFSFGECIWAQSILALLQEGQERNAQDDLRLSSLQHANLATQHAVRAGIPRLVLDAAKVGWNALIPLVDSDTTSALLEPTLRNLLDQLKEV